MTLNLDRDSLRDFGHKVVDEAAREISLLDAIEQTLDSLKLDQRMFGALAGHAEYVAERLESAKSNGNLIDSEGQLSGLFEKAQSLAEDYYQALIRKREIAMVDDRLCDEDCVVDAFTDAIATAADLHNSLNRLRWAIGEHDADLDKPKGKVYSDVDEMFSDMGL